MGEAKKKQEAGLTPEQLKEALADDQRRRVGEAHRAIQAVLEKYGVSMIPEVTLSAGNVTANIRLVPKG